MPTVCVCSFMDRCASTKRVPADQPTRGADRNHSLAEQADPTTDGMLLPTLDPGITLLDVEEGRGVPILQSIVLDHLLLHDGPAFWVDAHGHATTTTLAQIAPSHRLLSRIHVARGFTAYQHYSAVTDLSAAVNRSIQRSTPGLDMDTSEAAEPNENAPSHAPSLLVVPAVDAQYRDADTLGETHAATLQARTLARLSTYADGYDIPVLVTRSECDAFTAPVATAADHHLECEQTRLGPRIVGEEFETLVYPVADGAYYQTTLAYWRELLAARAGHLGMERTSATTSTPGEFKTGAMADGDAASATAAPLLDAWTATESGGR